MNLPRTPHFLLTALFFSSLFLLPGYTMGDEKKSPSADIVRHGGIYQTPLMNNPSTLDPAYVQDQYGVAVVQQLFDGLVRFDPYLMILPALAETWQVEEQGKVYRFVLRKNARFHNADPVTVQDVIFSISRLLRVNPAPAILPHLLKIKGAQDYRNQKKDQVEGLQIINDRVFLVRLEEPHAPFLTALGMYQAKIVPKAEVIRFGDRFGQNPVGSGPFRFISWKANKLIQLERFSGYYADPPFLKGIHYVIYPGGKIEDVLSDFKKGKLKEMPVYGKVREELSTEKELQWFHRPSLSLLFYGIRGDHPFLKNPELRMALSTAIDREELIRQVYNGQFEPARTILPPGMPGYHPQNQMVINDMSSARDHLKRAVGEKTESIPPLEIVSAIQSPFAKAELNFVRKQWAQLGIPVKIKFIPDWTQFEAYIRSDAVQIYRYVWFADLPDPDSFLYSLFASDSPVNFMHFQSKKVDQLLRSARSIIDPVKRAEVYREIEALVLKSSPLIPLFYLSIDRVYQPSVQGVRPSALGAHTMPLHRVWLKSLPSN